MPQIPYRNMWDYEQEQQEEQPKTEIPQDFWFAPYHKAIATKLVEVRKPNYDGPTNNGDVSDQE